MRGWFITGTDTGVGKTLVAEVFLTALVRAGLKAAGMKPVASGCRATPEGLRNEDAERLMAASAVPFAYEDINPYAFAPPVAPHLAAAAAGVEIRLENILERFERLRSQADYLVVEGAGGWYVPLGSSLTMADLARALDLPVILVVGMRLGCLNHAMLTAQAIRHSGCTLGGWVANRIDPQMLLARENVEALCGRLEAPLIAEFPYLDGGDPTRAAEAVDLERLTKILSQIRAE